MPSIIKTVYKICHAQGENKFVSYWLDIPDSLRKTYEISKKTKADIGKLYAFETLQYAEDTICRCSNLPMYILECKASISKFKPRYQHPNWASKGDIEDFWKRYIFKRNVFAGEPLPSIYKGTILCNWIIPIKLVSMKN